MRYSFIRFGLLAVVGMVFCFDAVEAQIPAKKIPANAMTFKYFLQTSDGKKRSIDEQIKVRRGQVLSLIIEVQLMPGYHSYPLIQDDSADGHVSSFSISVVKDEGKNDKKEFVLVPNPKETPKYDQLEWYVTDPEKGQKSRVHLKPFTWEQDLLVAKDALAGPAKVELSIKSQVCDEKGCGFRFPKEELQFEVSGEEPLEVSSDILKRLGQIPPPASPGSVSPPASPKNTEKKENIFGRVDVSQETYKKTMESIAGRTISAPDVNSGIDLWGFVLAGIFWGAISLITPCVFPMIPITVSIFLKQSEKEHHRPIVMASVYSGTIVVVLTLAAAFMLEVFRYLSVNPIMNYALGGLFVFFSLSLFGMYEIELPSSLARFTSAHEAKGGLVGTMFMALTFTIISFACVAPFLGGFGGTASGESRPLWVNLLGGLAFSCTFAAPFFFLALFPTLLRKMPKSGSWLNTVKVVMGFLELAAAVKFCRAAELVLAAEPWLLTFDLAMGIYIALAFFAGIYLLGVFRLPHDSPEEHLSVLRMVFAGCFFALAIYLAPSLIKNSEGVNIRPRGSIYSWVESFLLPDGAESLPHTGNLDFAVKKSIDQYQKKNTPSPQRIFLDFTGVLCTNCKINEQSVFTKRNIRQLLEQYLVVKLYCGDNVPLDYYADEQRSSMPPSRRDDDAMVNLDFQKRVFNSNEQLPLYAVLEPQPNGEIRVMAVYHEGRINNETAFAKFLRDNLKRAD